MNALAGLMFAVTVSNVPPLEGYCDIDRVFTENGWVIHQPAEFGAILETALQRIEGEKDLDHTSTTHVYNEELGKLIFRIAFDQAVTPADTMIDDLVLYADEETQAIYEVRWFDGAKKHIAYAGLSCANRPVPWAYNSMW